MREVRSHPGPLLERERWTDLDGEWELRFDDDRGLLDGWWGAETPFGRTITVPFPPESPLSGVEEDGHAVLWYRRVAELGRPVGDGRMLLHFTAVDYRADVWVNGIHVGTHEGGHVGFHFDITHALVDGERQSIVVRAFDDPRSLEQPRGKQDWEAAPHVIWYRRTTGIWRQVWAETVPAIHVERVRWTPGERPGAVTVDVSIGDSPAGDGFELELAFAVEGVPLARSRHTVERSSLTASFDLRDPRFDTEPERLLWSPERPTLIDVELTLWRGTETVDRVRSYLGLRTIEAEGQRSTLNGRPYFLRLVLEQAYWPQSHLAAPDGEAMRREVQLIKDLGFNGVRMHQTVADPRFLYWCDRLGLLVWADAPAAYRFSTRAIERTTREWLEIVARDASHPSIVTWVAFNESWGAPGLAADPAQRSAVRAMTTLLKSLDPTRLVIGNDGWEYVAGDLLGIHDYTQSGDPLSERYGTRDAIASTIEGARPGGRKITVARAAKALRLPAVLSEFGGISLTSNEGAWEGYGTVVDEAAFVARLESLIGAVASSAGLAGFCYTQLTDTLQEVNGLLDERRRPKAAIPVIRAIVQGTAQPR